MTHAPTRFRLLVAVAWCAVALAGCAAKRSHPPPSSTPAIASPATLQVTNANWATVRIYLVRGSMWLRLGTVNSGATAAFDIPPDFLGSASDVYLVASPLAGQATFTAPLLGVRAGDELELTVENLLQSSYLVVR